MTPGSIAYYLLIARERNTLRGLYLTESGVVHAE
jgi:hypothetical protein